jgi:hypothetical protein
MLTFDEIADIHERITAATPGSWQNLSSEKMSIIYSVNEHQLKNNIATISTRNHAADAAFISHAKSDLVGLSVSARMTREKISDVMNLLDKAHKVSHHDPAYLTNACMDAIKQLHDILAGKY